MNSNTKLCNFAKIFVTLVAILYNIINIVVAIRMFAPTDYEFGQFFVTIVSVCWLPLVISVFSVILFYIICNFFCDIEIIANNTRFRRNY